MMNSELHDMSAITNNRDKFFDSVGLQLNNFGNALVTYVSTISERALSLASITILHCIFLPSILAYLNSLSDKLPSLDSVLLVLLALTIMTLHAILKNDRLLIITHMIGFITNSVIFSMVIFR